MPHVCPDSSEAGNPFQRMDLKARIAKLEELRRRNLSEVRGSSHADRFGKWMK